MPRAAGVFLFECEAKVGGKMGFVPVCWLERLSPGWRLGDTEIIGGESWEAIKKRF